MRQVYAALHSTTLSYDALPFRCLFLMLTRLRRYRDEYANRLALIWCILTNYYVVYLCSPVWQLIQGRQAFMLHCMTQHELTVCVECIVIASPLLLTLSNVLTHFCIR